MNTENRFLKLLALKQEAPTLEFLTKIVKAHLALVPYENISKLTRHEKFGPMLPSFDEYVNDIEKSSFGGTCFAQNLHLNRLLQYLGFESRIVGIRKEGYLSHISLRVRIDQMNYWVDVGIMSPIAGPFALDSGRPLDLISGEHRYVFVPDDDGENYHLDIHRGGKVIRSFDSTSVVVSAQELKAGIERTYEPTALFMTVLCVHRAFDDHSVGLWDHMLYKVVGAVVEKKPVEDLAKLNDTFKNDLALSQYPVDRAYESVKKNRGTV